jgi:V/A-type H+-transporting ATPase subunit E
MENKVQEITEKIYREGVEKGETEAQQIIAEAESKKSEMLKLAQQEAEKIIAHAHKEADELSKHTHSELQMYAGRAVDALKNEITNLIADSLVHITVKETINNEWLQKLMLTLATHLAEQEALVIQTADAESLTQYFVKHAQALLNKNVKIEQVNGKKTDFAIIPAEKGYKIQFGETEFADFFKEFLRPKLVELLFAKK